jgi:hypothetical protein
VEIKLIEVTTEKSAATKARFDEVRKKTPIETLLKETVDLAFK